MADHPICKDTDAGKHDHGQCNVGLIGGFKSFDYIFALTKGGSGKSSSTLMYTIYKMAFVEMQYGKAEALAAMAFIFILVVSVAVLSIMRRKEIEA